MIISGRVTKYGDNVNTDEIIPGAYLVTTDPLELGKHCMEGLDLDFPDKVGKAPIIVAGRNFGCGSSREHAPVALKGAGVACVIAASFARIFFRNAVNIGLPIVECASCAAGCAPNDLVEIDTAEGIVFNKTKDSRYTMVSYPGFIQEFMEDGGIDRWVKENTSA